MTPAATTPAARKSSPHRRTRQNARPVAPRRVSGPVGGRTATAATAAGARAATAPGIALPRRSVHRPRVRLRPGAFIRSLPDHRLLDRLVRGRWWIPVLGVMLAGIVAMQVEVLKLGASMGRALEQNTALSGRNAALRSSVATLGDDQRIEQLAASMGMVMAPPQAVSFLAAHSDANAGKALANIHAPSASSFLSLTPSSGEIVTADTLAAANAPAGTTGSTSTIGSTSSSTSSTSSSTSASSTGAATGAVTGTTTTPSSTASSTATSPTTVTPAPTSSSSTTSSSQTGSQSQATTQPQGTTGPSTGAVGVGPPSTTTGG
jgi:hypothetical protein